MFRLATQEEIAEAGSNAELLEDFETAFDYARATYGEAVHRIKFEIDHDFDDGEENRYVGDEIEAWDKAGNKLPVIGEWSKYHEKPEFTTYEPWHMEFSLDDWPNVPQLYVKE